MTSNYNNNNNDHNNNNCKNNNDNDNDNNNNKKNNGNNDSLIIYNRIMKPQKNGLPELKRSGRKGRNYGMLFTVKFKLLFL